MHLRAVVSASLTGALVAAMASSPAAAQWSGAAVELGGGMTRAVGGEIDSRNGLRVEAALRGPELARISLGVRGAYELRHGSPRNVFIVDEARGGGVGPPPQRVPSMLMLAPEIGLRVSHTVGLRAGIGGAWAEGYEDTGTSLHLALDLARPIGLWNAALVSLRAQTTSGILGDRVLTIGVGLGFQRQVTR